MRVCNVTKIPRINEKEMCEETKLLLEIANGTHEDVTLEYDTIKQAVIKANVLCAFRGRHLHEDKIYFTQIIRRENRIYILRNGSEYEI